MFRALGASGLGLVDFVLLGADIGAEGAKPLVDRGVPAVNVVAVKLSFCR